MTELSFLIELLLNHDLPKATKDLLASRIKEVEQNLSQLPMGGVIRPTFSGVSTQFSAPQAQSTLDAMARHAAVRPLQEDARFGAGNPPEMPPVPVEHVAQTQAAVQAMSSRNQAIAESIAGKVDKTTGRPRKW